MSIEAPYGYKIVQPYPGCWTLIRVPRTRQEYRQVLVQKREDRQDSIVTIWFLGIAAALLYSLKGLVWIINA